MCNCGAVPLTNNNSNNTFSLRNLENVTSENCDYTIEMLQDFESKLVWFKNTGLFLNYNITPATMNKYLGIVLTSLNILNHCMYKETLDKVSDLCDLIISIQ